MCTFATPRSTAPESQAPAAFPGGMEAPSFPGFDGNFGDAPLPPWSGLDDFAATADAALPQATTPDWNVDWNSIGLTPDWGELTLLLVMLALACVRTTC